MAELGQAVSAQDSASRLTDAHRSYVRVETVASVVINVVLTTFFVVINFYGRQVIELDGPGGILRDAIPQNVITVFMSLLVPTWLTRRRCKAGVLTPLGGRRSLLPSNFVLRALAGALVIAAVAVPLTWVVLPLVSPAAWSFWPLLAFKALYSAILAAVVTPLGLIATLRDPVAIEGQTRAR